MGALAGPIAGGIASSVVSGMMSKGGGGNSGSYQENTPYVPRPRPSYMPTQEQYMNPDYYSPVSYGRYQAPARAPVRMAPAAAPAARGMMGGMNLIPLTGPNQGNSIGMFRDPEGNMDLLGDTPLSRFLQQMTAAGVDPKAALQYAYLSGAGLGGGSLVNRFGGMEGILGIDPSQVMTIGGQPYLISGNMAPPTALPATTLPIGLSGSGATGFRDAYGKSVGGPLLFA